MCSVVGRSHDWQQLASSCNAFLYDSTRNIWLLSFCLEYFFFFIYWCSRPPLAITHYICISLASLMQKNTSESICNMEMMSSWLRQRRLPFPSFIPLTYLPFIDLSSSNTVAPSLSSWNCTRDTFPSCKAGGMIGRSHNPVRCSL